MPAFRPRLLAHLRFRAAAYIVLLVALVPTAIVYWRVQKNVHARDEARFDASMLKVEETFREEMQLVTADLLGISGFFEATTNVTREEWSSFIAKLDMPRRHPGLRSVGFAECVPSQNIPAFTRTMRRRHDPEYLVHPPTTERISFPTVMVTMFSSNVIGRVGWDSYSEEPRRATIDAMIRTGLPAITDKLQYWRAEERDGQGFAILVPVRGSGPGATNGALRGMVFGSFIPQRMFNAVANRKFDSNVRVELFDGPYAEQSSLLAEAGGAATANPQFSKTRATSLLNHTFSFRVSTLPEFHALSETQLPIAVLSCGLGISFLLFAITWTQGNARSASDRLNQRLRDSEERLRTANSELEHKIAEAKITEGLLAYERDLLRMLLDHSPDPIYFKDIDSRFIKCSHAITRHLGVENVRDAIGKTDFDFFAEEHARPAFNCEQQIIQTGEPVIGLVEKETWPDGRETWVMTSKMPLRDKTGTIIGTFGITKDITKLKTTEFALAKEKEMLAVTLRSIGDGVIATDVEGRIVLFNQVAEQLTGWTQAEAANQFLRDAFRTHRPGGEADTEVFRRAIAQSQAQPAHDTVLLARDGSERNISQSLAPIINQEGKTVGAVLVFRDITERLKTEAELLKASKLESIGLLAGGIAHDFNNVLTVILGNISLARMAQSTGRPMSDVLLEAENASLRARELTQRLLTFARGGAPIKKPLHLAPLARECAARAFPDGEVATGFFIGDELWPVHADEAQISQVLQNLISHARTSMNKDPRLDIHVLNQEITNDPLLFLKPGRYVRVSIRDYGAGIQQENLTKIFEPYFGPKKQGSGLELATAYSIVRKHEGQIRVESIAEQGTVFHVYLPAAPVSEPATPKELRPRLPRVLPRRVLVMDDELPIRKLAVHLLQRIGCTAETAADGAEAIKIYETARRNGEPFQAVIMDLTVPNGMGGKETIRELRALDPEVRAIVSSGYSHDPVMANYRDFGFAGVVPKPYSSDDLAAALDEIFAGGDETLARQ
jgi:PAS domain S-box-containing protein